MSLAGIAKANQTIFDEGHYTAPSGRIVELSDALASAVSNTRLYTPDELTRLLARTPRAERGHPEIEVVEGKTGDVGRAVAARIDDVPIILNFASARNPGGGYVRGAKAQEEDLARCSGLHPTLLSQPAYYDVNRKTTSLLYTDHIIVSPRVPFFRDDAYRLLEAPTLLSVLTAPAPNAGEVLRRDPSAGPDVQSTLQRRAGMVLAVAEDQNARNVVLGAWGCGVFRNDPVAVAEAFGHWFESPRFAGAFDRVVFGIYERGRGGPTVTAFRTRFP